MTDTTHFQVLIIGGGTAGITVAARLRKKKKDLEIAIIEPSERHYYQPLWTLVGGGVIDKNVTERNEEDYIPDNVAWLKEYAETLVPDEKKVITRSGRVITYDYLVISAGVQLDWHKIKGLKETIGKNGVCSNYSFKTVEYTWELVRNFKGGTALFTQPGTPIKCGGAPQKAVYLSEDYFRKKSKVRDKAKVTFISGLASIFGIAKYRKSLEKVLQRKGIEAHFRYELIEVKSESREAVFKHLDNGEEKVVKYDILHVVPPMSTPDFVKKSPLADGNGFVSVDKFTTRHTKYQNVFALGDCSNLPTAKTGAAIRKQAPVLVENLLRVMEQKEPDAQYDGYSSCPLVTGYGSLILAEFDYSGKPAETFPFDQSRERLSMYMLKAYALPQMYWHGMLKGRM